MWGAWLGSFGLGGGERGEGDGPHFGEHVGLGFAGVGGFRDVVVGWALRKWIAEIE